MLALRAQACIDRVKLGSRLFGAASGVFLLVGTAAGFFGFLVSTAFGFAALTVFFLVHLFLSAALGFATLAIFGLGVGLSDLVASVQRLGGKWVAGGLSGQSRDSGECRAQSDGQQLLLVHEISPERLVLGCDPLNPRLEGVCSPRSWCNPPQPILKLHKAKLFYVFCCL
jgi:hypothetical protein